MSLEGTIRAAASGRTIHSLIHRDKECGLTADEKLKLEEILTASQLDKDPNFYSFLEHALFVADNKYNQYSCYNAIKNCIYDSMT